MQEARQAFWLQMQTAEDEEELLRRAPCRMYDAMWEYCRSMASVYIPHNQYQKQIKGFTCCTKDVLDMEDQLPACTMENEEFQIMLELALNHLPPDEETVIRMQLAGHRNCEIMPVLHIRSIAVMSRLSRRAAEHLAQNLGWEIPGNRRQHYGRKSHASLC